MLCAALSYFWYLTPQSSNNNVAINKDEGKKELIPDIIFDAFSVKTPSQKGFVLNATAKKASIYKQQQHILLTDFACVYKKNNILFGSINAQKAIVDQLTNKITFQIVHTELNLSSDIQQIQ